MLAQNRCASPRPTVDCDWPATGATAPAANSELTRLPPWLQPAPGLVMEILFSNTRAVVGRKGHPMAQAGSLKELASAEWATTSIDYNANEDLSRLFARHDLPPPKVALQAGSALSLMVALSETDLLAMLPRQWADFPLTAGTLHVIPVREHLPAPDIVLIRRPDLPLTPAGEHLVDLMLRSAPGQDVAA